MIIVLPIILPLAFAIIMLFAWKIPKYHKYINLTGSILLLIVAVILLNDILTDKISTYQMGNWTAPFGISLVADYLSTVMVLISAIIFVATSVYSIATIDSDRVKFGYFPLLQTLMMGINGSFLTGDVFNLYVWFEVMLISSFVLLALGGKKEQLEGAIKYVTLNLLSSALFLAAVGILYGLTGTLNMADLAVKITAVDKRIVNVVSMLFLVAFGIKAAIFPLFFWLPASYHTPHSAVSAIFAGLLTKVGVYALMRVFTLIFIQDVNFTHYIILILSGFTMLVGVLGAAAQYDFRRILSFHIISQIGYMIMGLGLFSPLAIAGGVFYLIHHIIVKTNLFFVSGVIKNIRGTYDLKKLGGIYKLYPIFGLLFLIPALSLAGIPPLSGFWAKFTVIKAGLELNEYTIVIVSLIVGLLTLYSMTKIWNEVFWKDETDEIKEKKRFSELEISKRIFMLSPIIVLAIITVIIGLYAEPFFEFATETSKQLLNKNIYINAVLKR